MKIYDSFKLMIHAIQADIDRYVLIRIIQSDIERFVWIDNFSWLVLIFTRRGIWATTQYRVSRWIHYEFHVPILRTVFKLICAIWRLIIEITTGIELPNRAEIGKGLFIPHAHGIIINSNCQIGENCNLSQGVSIGVAGRGDKAGSPKLGDRVFIAPGAKIFGPITIGNDVAVGANAVVNKDLPDGAVAVGIPAKIINYKGSHDFIIYRDREAPIKSIKVEETLLS